MSITLAEATVGLSDKVTQEVIDEFRRGSDFLDRLTFDDAVSPGTGGSTLTYGYQQLSTPSTAASRAINSEYATDEAKRVKKTVDLKIFGGAALIDRVLADASNEISFQLEQKVKAIKNYFQYTAINGSKTGGSTDFEGLSSLLKGASTEYNAGADKVELDLSTSAMLDANYKYAADMIDEFMEGINGEPDMLIGNAKSIAKFKSIARRLGYMTKSENAFGKQTTGYGNSQFYNMGNYRGIKYNCPTAVRWLQKMVGATVDGIFGAETERKVKEYQKKHNLTADGIVGLNTTKALLCV